MSPENGAPLWWGTFKELLEARFKTLDERFDHTNKALELQAKEYERRLHDLNNSHERALSVQHTFVSVDKYEDRMESDALARKLAFDRVEEKIDNGDGLLHSKLDAYITKAEARQAEMDLTIASQKGAAEEAQRAAEEQGRKSNRNMAIMGLALTIIIAVSNYIGSGA